MKALFYLSFIMCLLTACKKDEVSFKGTLRIKCEISQKDYENIIISLSPIEAPNAVLYSGHPDSNGIYEKALLQGNYSVTGSYVGHGTASDNIQIIGGETKEVTFQF